MLKLTLSNLNYQHVLKSVQSKAPLDAAVIIKPVVKKFLPIQFNGAFKLPLYTGVMGMWNRLLNNKNVQKIDTSMEQYELTPKQPNNKIIPKINTVLGQNVLTLIHSNNYVPKNNPKFIQKFVSKVDDKGWIPKMTNIIYRHILVYKAIRWKFFDKLEIAPKAIRWKIRT